MSQSTIYIFRVVHDIGPSLQLINNVNSRKMALDTPKPDLLLHILNADTPDYPELFPDVLMQQV